MEDREKSRERRRDKGGGGGGGGGAGGGGGWGAADSRDQTDLEGTLHILVGGGMSNGKWQLVPGRWACCYCIWCRRMEFQQDLSEEERSCREGANSSIKILCSCSLQATSFNMGEVHTDRVDACLADPANCTFGRMTVVFYILLRQHGAGYKIVN